MTLNLFHTGEKVVDSLTKVSKIIKQADPDIVCFSEDIDNGQNWVLRLTNQLSKEGLSYEGSYFESGEQDVSLISKFPITQKSIVYGANYFSGYWYQYQGSIAKFKVDVFSNELTVGCAHIDWDYYATYLPRGYAGRLNTLSRWSFGWNKEIDILDPDGDGIPNPNTDVEEILSYNSNSYRDEQINAFIEEVKDQPGPIVLLGDFNEPSHLDWTEATKDRFNHHQTVIPWQNTLNLENQGFVDAYRNYFPNPLTHPGITWPSKVDDLVSPTEKISWLSSEDERERIDFIFYKGKGIQTVAASLVGPRESYAYGKLANSHTKNEYFIAQDLSWPSDHKGVMVRLSFSSWVNSDSLKTIASDKTLD